MTGGFPQLASDAGQMAMRLAGLLADPLPSLSETARKSLVPAAIGPLLGQPKLRRSLSAGLGRMPEGLILPRIASLLVAGPLPVPAQKSFDLALLPQSRLDPWLARLAAVIHAPRFRLAVLKPEREALQLLFGSELSRLATEEGLSLMAPLGDLDDGTPFPPITEQGLYANHPARKLAAQVLCARLSRDSDEAAVLLWWRITGTAVSTWPTISPRQDACLTQLMARSGVAE